MPSTHDAPARSARFHAWSRALYWCTGTRPEISCSSMITVYFRNIFIVIHSSLSNLATSQQEKRLPLSPQQHMSRTFNFLFFFLLPTWIRPFCEDYRYYRSWPSSSKPIVYETNRPWYVDFHPIPLQTQQYLAMKSFSKLSLRLNKEIFNHLERKVEMHSFTQ